MYPPIVEGSQEDITKSNERLNNGKLELVNNLNNNNMMDNGHLNDNEEGPDPINSTSTWV
jgi:hypothetical protein